MVGEFAITFKVKTEIDNFCIIQRTFRNDIEEVQRRIICTKEKAIHDALVQLGWTPPKDK